MNRYEIPVNVTYSDIVIIYAENEDEAAERLVNEDWDDCIDGEIINVEQAGEISEEIDPG